MTLSDRTNQGASPPTHPRRGSLENVEHLTTAPSQAPSQCHADSFEAIDVTRTHSPALAVQPHPHFRPIIEEAWKPAATTNVSFNPTEHLAYQGAVQTTKMEDLGFAPNTGVSPVAVSAPFRLFSDTAIQQMRSEVFNPDVMAEFGVQSNIAACQIRGWAKTKGPFTYSAWTHPETLAIVSKIAGVDLVPQFDYEIAHINFSVKSDKQTADEREAIQKTQKRNFFPHDEGIDGCAWESESDHDHDHDHEENDKPDKPVVGWHKDSYPFVCVLMLSDCTDMVGGETVLDCPNGAKLRVRGPQQGYAVVLQGRYINHQALRALGSKERITAVTSFRPRDPMVKDDTVLTTVRPVSDLSELYGEFAEYRLEIMEARIRKQREEMAARRKANQKFDTVAHKQFLQESIAFLEHSNNEIVEDEKVIQGFIKEEDIPDTEVVPAEEDGPLSLKRVRTE